MTNRNHAVFLVFDVGLTRVKAALVSEHGTLLATVTFPYDTHRAGANRAEQDPLDWWKAVVESSRRLRESHPDELTGLVGVAVTGHMHALVCVDDKGHHVGPAIVLGDTRAALEADQISNDLGLETIYDIIGCRLDASMPAAKAAWLIAHEPERWAQTRLILSVKDYIRCRMTGDRLTDPVDATATSLYDIRQGSWSPAMLSAVGLRPSMLPDVVPSASIAEGLQREAAYELGLPSGLPVIVGAGDDVEVLGRGVLAPGEALEHIGTTGSIMSVVDEPLSDPMFSLEVYPHSVPGLWVVGGAITAAGAALAWAARMLRFDGFAEAAECLANGRSRLWAPVFLPNLAGSRAPEWDPAARGAWVGLGMAVEREDMMYAAFEGVAFALRDVLDRVVDVAGPQRLLHVTDEGTSDAWLGFRAAVYGYRLSVSASDPTALGAAVLAADALGVHEGVEAAVQAMVAQGRWVGPDQVKVADLAIRRERFRAASDTLAPAWGFLGLAAADAVSG